MDSEFEFELFKSIVTSTSRQFESITPTVHAFSTIDYQSDIPKLNVSNSSKPVTPQQTAEHSVSAISSNTTNKKTFTNASDGSNLVEGFRNSSCSGNNTGCPEYNGRHGMTLTTPEIIGIAVGAAVIVIIVVCTLLFVCRRRQTLSGSKADLSAYWEDNVTLSYINGHIDYPKDGNDEMISLDNDSFLNSLDSVSFTNLWAAEHAKHTNF